MKSRKKEPENDGGGEKERKVVPPMVPDTMSLRARLNNNR